MRIVVLLLLLVIWKLQDGIVRQRRERDYQAAIERAKEISLKQFEKEEAERSLQKSKEEGKRKQVEEEVDKGQFKHSKDKEVALPK